MSWVIQGFVQLWIVEVDIGDSFSILDILRVVNAKLLISNGKLLELHYVLRQSACLVTKYVVHHA